MAVDLASAIEIAERAFPDRRLIGNPAEYRGRYAFPAVEKDYAVGEPNWDATIVAVDMETGEVSCFNAFGEPGFWTEAVAIAWPYCCKERK